MKKFIQIIPAVLWACLLSGSLTGQTVLVDYETPATSIDFEYFGSTGAGGLTMSISNPATDGVNQSETVGEYFKPAESETWAGAFGDPSVPLDFTTNTEVCVKVHMDHIGNVAFKVEGSTTDGPDWIQVANYLLPNTWQELCFNVNEPSLPDSGTPGDPAIGNIYTRMVLFFDYGSVGMDQFYYYDDITVTGGFTPEDAVVTFNLDLSEYEAAYDKVYLNGTFNDWCGACLEMLDEDGDGTYTVTDSIPSGIHEYKFTLDETWEQFTGLETCIIQTDDFVNRKLVASGNMVLDPVCFESCYDCGQSVNITFELGFPQDITPTNIVSVAGGESFGIPGTHVMTLGSNGFYSITVERELGFAGDYTFANGDCPDYSCKEMIEGQACAMGEFNDRRMPAVNNDTIIRTCFETCVDTNDGCAVDDTGIEDLKLNLSSFQIQPNLVKDFTNIKFTNIEFAKDLKVFDLSGKLQLEYSLGQGQDSYRLDASMLSNGTYFLLVESQGTSFSSKFIKQ